MNGAESPEEQGKRLKRARLTKGLENLQAAAVAFGFNVNTLKSNENGIKPFSRKAAIRYANAYGVRLDWLLSGKGPMRHNRTLIEVEGIVGAGAAVFPIDDGAFEPIEPPFSVPDGAIAFVVQGDSMYPAYRAGTYLIAYRADDLTTLLSKRAVVTLEDGRRLVKDVALGSKPGLFTLYSHNAQPIADVRLIAGARVLGTKEPD